MVDHGEFRGNPVRTLDVTYPNFNLRKIVVWAIPLSTLFIIAILSYFAVFYFKDDSYFQTICIYMIVGFVALDASVSLFYQSLLGRNWHRIVFFENGVQFPNYLWDRMRGREAFLKKAKIVSVRASFITDPKIVGTKTSELIFRTNAGKSYRTGYRINSDIISISKWLETDWGMKVERTDLRGNPVSPPHKVRVVSEPAIRRCAGCGYSFINDLGFCPSCGRIVSDVNGPIDRSAAEGSENPPATAINDYSAPQEASKGYGLYQYQLPRDRYAKNPRTAMILAAVLGLLGIMGIGHIYMGKIIKGVAILLLGGFLALLSAGSIILIFTPDEFSFEVKVISAVILTAPFLILFLWQVFDAPKPTSAKDVQDPYGYNKPPNGP